MNEEINSSFTSNPDSSIIDGKSIVENIIAKRKATPENYGRTKNLNTGEVLESKNGSTTESSNDNDSRYRKLDEIKQLIGESKQYIQENQLDFDAPKYNSKRYAKLDSKQLDDEYNRLLEHKNSMIENAEYVPTDDDQAEYDVEAERENNEYNEFASRFPSLRDGQKYPSNEDMARMTDNEVTRWFGEDY